MGNKVVHARQGVKPMTADEFEDFMDDILAEIEPDYIPAEFVSIACITDAQDEVRTISREEFEEIMSDDESLEDKGIVEIGLVLDLTEVKSTIREYVEIILKDVAL
jgi:hypothetical protein